MSYGSCMTTATVPPPTATQKKRTSKPYSLHERTLAFAQDVRTFVGKLPRTTTAAGDAKQLIYSSGAIGSNYIEADAAFSNEDFTMRMKICRREAKESTYWLQLLDIDLGKYLDKRRKDLLREANELVSIFNAIVEKMVKKSKSKKR